MVSPKAVQALVVFLFIGVVTVGLFFLLSRQLAPLLEEIDRNSASRNSDLTTTFTPTPPLPATLTAMNQVLAATVAPLAMATTPALTGAPTIPKRVGIVNSDVVNVRSYPDLAGDVIGQAKEGDRLEILSTSTDGQWLQVCCPLGTNEGDRQSWVAAELVTVQQAVTVSTGITPHNAASSTPVRLVGTPAAPQAAGDAVMGIVNGSWVNLRGGPGTTYAVVGQVQERSAIELTGRDAASTWWRICCPPGAPAESWISAEFVDIAMPRAEVLMRVPVVDVVAIPSITSTAD